MLLITLIKPPWVVWLSGLNAGLQTKTSLVQFQVKEHAWVVGQVPGWGRARGSQFIYLLHIDVFLPPFLSL